MLASSDFGLHQTRAPKLMLTSSDFGLHQTRAPKLMFASSDFGLHQTRSGSEINTRYLKFWVAPDSAPEINAR